MRLLRGIYHHPFGILVIFDVCFRFFVCHYRSERVFFPKDRVAAAMSDNESGNWSSPGLWGKEHLLAGLVLMCRGKI